MWCLRGSESSSGRNLFYVAALHVYTCNTFLFVYRFISFITQYYISLWLPGVGWLQSSGWQLCGSAEYLLLHAPHCNTKAPVYFEVIRQRLWVVVCNCLSHFLPSFLQSLCTQLRGPDTTTRQKCRLGVCVCVCG